MIGMRCVLLLLAVCGVFGKQASYPNFHQTKADMVSNELTKMLGETDSNHFEITSNSSTFSIWTSSALLNVQCFVDETLVNYCLLERECSFNHGTGVRTYKYLVDVISPENNTNIGYSEWYPFYRSTDPLIVIQGKGFFGNKGRDNYEIKSKAPKFVVWSSFGLINVTCHKDGTIISKCLMKNECIFEHDLYVSLLEYKINVVSMRGDTVINFNSTRSSRHSNEFLLHFVLAILCSFFLTILVAINQ